MKRIKHVSCMYDLISAVRGPDERSDVLSTLKSEVTTRVRFILLGNHYCPGDICKLPMSRPDLKRVKMALCRRQVRRKHWHFITHLAEAVYSSRGHPIWGRLGKELYEALSK